MVPEPFGGRKSVSAKNNTIFIIQYSNYCWLLCQPFPRGFSGTLCPSFCEVSLAATKLHLAFPAEGVQHTSISHLQILRGFLREAGGILQGHIGSFWISFTCSLGGWFMRDSWGCPVSPSHESVHSHSLCCKGGGTVNLQGSQVQQKTVNSGSLFSLTRTDVHQISSGFNLQSWLFHHNSQRA